MQDGDGVELLSVADQVHQVAAPDLEGATLGLTDLAEKGAGLFLGFKGAVVLHAGHGGDAAVAGLRWLPGLSLGTLEGDGQGNG